MSLVLITGGAGFIGVHLARALVARGDRVVLWDNFSRGVKDEVLASLLETGSCELMDVDIRGNSLPRMAPDAIVHLAAIVGVRHVVDRPADVLHVNTRSLENMLAFAQDVPTLRNFVFASTSEVYAGSVQLGLAAIPTPEETPLVVTDPANPRGTYALSKIYGEALCHHSNVPTTIVRPHNIFGPRMGLSHVIPELLNKAWVMPQDQPLGVASPEHTRTFCYVSDAIRYLTALVDSEGQDRVFNLGREDPETSIATLAQLVVETTGIDRAISALPDTPGSPKRRAPETSQLIAATGITPEVSLEEGLALTFDWYLHNVFTGTSGSAV